MPTPTGHTRAITASRVTGTTVYNAQGESIGHVEDIVLDKMSDKILFAVLGFGGFLGIGEKFHAVPWSILNYNEDNGGYAISLTREELEKAPAYEMDDLLRNDGDALTSAHSYYDRFASEAGKTTGAAPTTRVM